MESKYNEDIPRSQYYRREIVPTVVQMEMVECGAASLSMILGYYGKFISLEELRVACGVSRDGASVLGILNAAQSYGLLAEGHMVNLEEVYEMPLPMIAYWEFKHFVVLEGFSREAVYINDPAVGPYAIPYDQFNRSFTGIVCVFEPTPNFVKSGKPVSTMAVIYELISKAKTPFFYAFLAGICLVIPGLAVPAFTQVFVDSILINHIYSWQGWFFFLMGVVAVVTILLKYLQLNILARLYVQLSTRISAEFLWKALRQSYVYYLLHHTGEIANRTQYLESVSRTVSSRLTGMVIDVIGAVVFAIAMFYYDPLIALFGIAIMAGDLYLMSYLYRSREDAYYYYQQTSIKAMSYSINSLKSMETLKATGMEYIYYSRWAGYYTKSLNALKEIGKKDIYSGVFPQFLKTLTLIMILSFGAWRVIEGHLTAGMLMALIMLMDNFTAPVTRLVGANQILQLLKINTARINDVLNSPMDKTLVQAEKDDKRLVGDEPVAKLKGGIELKNITYGYDRTIDPIIKNVSLKINPGTYVGVVGSTGSGKSTLSKIISGLIYPWEGELLFDYKPRSELPRSLIVNSLAVVEQEANLFSGTVKDNISFFNPLVAQEVIIEAAKDACIHDMILSRKGGYELHLKANGSNLSGGERQRIELARALAKKPSILILDEATSALDTDVEASVMQNIRHRGVTCVIIAHRISTTRYCDEIIVLDKGEIVQRGTPDELLAQPGLYKELSDLEKNKQMNVS